VREGDAAEAVGFAGFQAAVGGELVPAPQDESESAGLEEDGLLDFLPLPAERFVEGLGAGEVRDAEGDQGDSLFHEGWPFKCEMRAVKAGVGKERVAWVGVFESRMNMRVERSAISTQVSPSPPPEYVDFRQFITVPSPSGE
jgi:hypothetical protein